MKRPAKRKIKVRGILCVSEDQHILYAVSGKKTDKEIIDALQGSGEWHIEATEAVVFVEFDVEVTLPAIPTIAIDPLMIEQPVPVIKELKDEA